MLRVVVHVFEWRDVAHDPAVRAQQLGIAQGFHWFHRQHQTGGAIGNQVAGNGLVGDAHEGGDSTAALRHAVHLGLFEMQTDLVNCVIDHPGDRQHTLATDAAKHQVVIHADCSSQARL